jgi:hypothetical protein
MEREFKGHVKILARIVALLVLCFIGLFMFV